MRTSDHRLSCSVSNTSWKMRRRGGVDIALARNVKEDRRIVSGASNSAVTERAEKSISVVC